MYLLGYLSHRKWRRMAKIHKMLLGFTLIVTGLLNLINLFGIAALNFNEYYYYILQFIGLAFVFTSIGKSNYGMLFAGSTLFMTGVTLLVVNQFEILSPVKIILPSVLVISGTGFIMLYIDNMQENTFLILSVIQFAIAILLIKFGNEYSIINRAGRVAYLILEFWPVLISLLGIGILVNRKRRW